MRYLLVSVFIVLIFSACQLDNDTVAMVGNFPITKEEFLVHLQNNYGKKDSYKDINEKNKKVILDQLILRKQKLNEAYKMGLDKNERFQIDYADRKRQMLSNIYYEKMLVDKIISDSMITEDFNKTKYEVNASHVLISFKGAKHSSNERSQEEAYKLAQKIVQKIRNGGDINKLAYQYSDDRSKVQNHGNLGYFTWGKMVDKFQEVAFSLGIHEVSDPVLTDFGYHVIYVNDKRENKNFNIDNLKNEREEIKKRLYYKNRDKAKKMWDKQLKDLDEKNNFKIIPENIKKFVDNNNELKKQNNFSIEKIRENQSYNLAEWNNGACTTNDLIDSYLKRTNYDSVKCKSSLADSGRINKDIEFLANYIFVAQISESLGFLKEKSIKQQMDNFLEYSLISLAEKKIITNKIALSDSDLQKYYSENQSEFTIPEKLEMWEIFVKDQKMANQVYKYAKNGSDFEKLAKFFSQKRINPKNRGRLGYRNIKSLGIISENAFKAGPHQILKPFKYQDGWVIIKTGEKKEKSLRSYNDSVKLVARKVRSQKIIEIRNQWEDYLKKTYKPEINENLLADI